MHIMDGWSKTENIKLFGLSDLMIELLELEMVFDTCQEFLLLLGYT